MTLVHMMWLWLWFSIGTALYWLKRAYYLITGPNPIANSYGQFVERCWPPLIVRAGVGAGVYWVTFYPAALQAVLLHFGWSNFASTVSTLTSYAPFAFFFGLGVDNGLDFGLSKTPVLKDWLPQMPGPLPKADVANPPAPQDRKAEGI